MTNETRATTQVYQVRIRATAQAVWDAITQPDWTDRYGYGGRSEYELRPGGRFRNVAGEAMKRAGQEMGRPVPDITVDGEVIEADPPRKLVQTWRMLMDAELAAEGFTRLTYEIGEGPDGTTTLTVVHELERAPKLAVLVGGQLAGQGAGGGWPWVLDELKNLLETGNRQGS